MVKGGGKNKQGPGYEGVDPAAECNINKTSKFAVWDAPGVSQPPPKPGSSASGKATADANLKQKQNNNRKFTAAATTAPTGGGGGKGFPPTVKLTCACEKVVLSLPGPALNRVESCDVDSRFAMTWCSDNLKGWGLATPYVDMVFLANCLQIDQGGDDLEVFMIKEGYNTQRVVATCCGTLMLGDHPAYQHRKLVAYIPPAKMTLKNCELMPAQARIFEDDYSSAEQAQMWLKNPFDKPAKPAPVPDIDLNKWKAKHPRYTNLQTLIGSIGPLQYMDPTYDSGKEPEWNRLVKASVAAGNN